MKKLIAAAVAIGILSTNAFAIWVEGTVAQVRVNNDSTYVVLKKANDALQSQLVEPTLTADQKKAFLAAVMTAYASGATVVLSGPSSNWEDIILK